uniref:Loxtox protein n=1 Tax=Loxosceles similis TaxID=321804 RepID=A0A1B2ASA3_LOXSM|nr:loxtox protein [Loxosceles similis]
MYVHLALILGCWTIILQGSEADIVQRADNRRPIWNMGHMVNAVAQINTFLDLGSNALEMDITFNKQAMPVYTYHGTPCDCLRDCLRWEYFSTFVQELRQRTTPGDAKYRQQLILLIFDLKTGSINNNQARTAGINMAQQLLQHYWNNGNNGGRAYIVLSIPYLEHYELVRGFRDTLRGEGQERLLEKVGYDFSGRHQLSSIGEAYKKAGVNGHVWQSDGITNCLPLVDDLPRVREAVRNRDSSNGFINKVYYWTVDKVSTTKKALSAGVDGIMTNKPSVIVDVLNESGIRDKYRLATYEDNPWETFRN